MSARPKHRCRICQHPFYEGEDDARIRHARRCVRKHDEKLRAEAEVQNPSVLDEYPFTDPDFDEWARRNGWAT